MAAEHVEHAGHAGHEPWCRRADVKPADGHLFWWFMFGNGGGFAAVFLPVVILVAGILGPLGAPSWMEDAEHFAWVLENPIIKLFLIVLCLLTFVHPAHRLRYTLYDVGVRGSKPALEYACYGLAMITISTAAAAVSRMRIEQS
jgi:fumarate reductase subunit D